MEVEGGIERRVPTCRGVPSANTLGALQQTVKSPVMPTLRLHPKRHRCPRNVALLAVCLLLSCGDDAPDGSDLPGDGTLRVTAGPLLESTRRRFRRVWGVNAATRNQKRRLS